MAFKLTHIQPALLQACYYVKDISASKSLQKHLVQASILSKSYGTEASLQKDVSSTDEKGYLPFLFYYS